MSLAELEQLLTEEKTRLNEIEASQSKLGVRLALELARPVAARDQLSKANMELNKSVEELNAVAPVLESGELTEARRWYLQTRISVITAEEVLRSTRSKLAIAGVNVAVGQLLVEQKRELIDQQLWNR